MALRYIHLQIIDKNKYWNDLIYMIAKGDASQYADLKRMDIIEFFHLVDQFRIMNEPPKKKPKK